MSRVRILVALSVAVATVGSALVATSAASPSGAAAVGGIYRGNDGSTVYLRQLGKALYGFAEHPGRRYATVFTGTVTGSNLTGSWWDVPKGSRKNSGALKLTVSKGGASITHAGGSFGPTTMKRIKAGAAVKWPGPQHAAFQDRTSALLDGAFRGDDGSSHYIRQIGNGFVWYGERFPSAGARPSWATIFVGNATGNGGLKGVWIDLPKGKTVGTGGFTGARVQIDRAIVFQQHGLQGPPRANDLAADWALDMDAFAQVLRVALDGNAVGYAWAVVDHGAVIRAEASGSRRLAQDGGVLPFTTSTQSSAASTTKLVTAVAMLKLLEEKKLPVTTKVAPYLPACWKKTGAAISLLTFEDLLDHSSRIDRGLGANACSADPYECLRRSIENGQSGSAGYDNINYALLRYFIPLVENYAQVNGIFNANQCGDDLNPNVRATKRRTINLLMSSRFDAFLQSRLLKPFGIVAGYSSTGDNWAYGYDFTNLSAPGDPPNEQAILTGGSGGMKWSADAYARFLGVLEAGKIVKLATVRQMKTGRLGYNGAAAGAAGSYPTKSGGAGNFESRVMVYPGRVGVYVTINQRVPGSLTSVLTNAFDAALK